MPWNCEGTEVPKSPVSLDMLRYSNSYLLTLPVLFVRQNVY